MMVALYLLAWIWSLPTEIIGLVLLPFYGPVSVEFRDGVFLVTVTRLIGYASTTGQTWGRLSYRKPNADTSNWVHERRHVTQCDVLGPLWLIAYPVASLIAALTVGSYYQDNWFERDARRAAGQ